MAIAANHGDLMDTAFRHCLAMIAAAKECPPYIGSLPDLSTPYNALLRIVDRASIRNEGL